MATNVPFERAVRWGVGLGVSAAAAIASLVLVSWVSGHWMAGTFGPGYLPMAPSTALAVLALGIAILLLLRPTFSRVSAAFGWSSVLLALLSCTLSLALPVLGSDSFLSVWLSPVKFEIGGVPAGVMSPLTAVVLFLLAAALALHLPPFGRQRALRQAAALLALTGGAICAVVMLGYLFDSPLLYGTRTVPMALPTGAALTLLALGLVITSGPATWPASLVLPDRGRGPLPWPARGPFAALLTLSAAILITGGCHLSTQMANMRQAARTELDAVANLKKEQIAGWRQERMNDARFFSNAAFVSRDIQALLEHPKDESVRGETLNWLTLLKGGERYTSAAIVDPRGDVLLSVPPQKDGAGDPRFSALVRDTVAGNAIQLTDLHPDDAGGMHLDLTVPVHAPEAGRAAAPPIAVIALRMNPAHFLFPLLQKWPSPVETAETLLVRREGDEVVILNEPRHHTGAAMRRRFSVDTPDLPSAMAVRGVTGIGEGVDYRGVRVVAVARRVPDSDWYLVAKEDKSEIYAASWRQAIRVAGIMALLLLAGTLFILALWRQRNLEYYRDRLEQERQRTILAQRFEHLMRQASDLIVITGADGRIVEINDRAVQAYGFSPGELCGTDLSSLRTEAARPAMGAQMRELEDQGSAFFETEHRRADGTAFPVEISARLVDIGGAQHRLFIVRDITERREREQEIDRLNRMYAALSRVNQAIVRSAAEAELLAQVCGALVDEAGFRIAWTGRYDPESGTVRQRAWHGKCCLDAVEVAFLTDGGDTGKSPVITTAVRGDCVVVCRDLSASPSSPDVRLRIDAVGITAAAVFPIHLRGEIWGVLAVGASEPGCFGDREIALLEEAAQDLSFALEHLAGELERRQAGEAVRRSEQNLAMAEEIAHVGYWERAVDGGILHWSDEAYRIFGLEPQERPMNLSSFLAMVHPEDRGSVEEAIRATREEDRPYNVEYRIVRPGGAVRFVHSQGELLLDSMGQSERMFGTMLDVTERKWTEQALRESKRQATELADMLQNASQPFCVGYPDGRLGVSNGAMQAMLGYTAEEITALDWANDVTPAEWLDLERAQLARLHDTGIPVRYEKEYIRKDGTRVPVELLVHLLRDEGGAPRQYYAFITDITERKCAEGKLRESEQRFRMIAENTGDVIWRLDAATRRFTYISPSILRLRGFTPEEAMSQDIRSSLTPESHEKLSRHILERVAAFKAGDESARIMMQEVRQPHKNGSILTTEVVSTLIVNGQGAITEILGVTRDITARKRAEEALRESERHYRIIAENTGDVIWQLDLASMRFTYVSPSVLRLRGYTPEEVMAQPVEAALTPDSVVTMVQGIADYLSAPPEEQSRRLVNTSIVRQPCKDGSIVTTEAVTTVLTDGQGGITGVLGVSRDITERVRAEEALRTSEQRFRAAFEDGLFGMVLCSPDGRFVDVNPAFCQMLHRSREDLLSRSFQDVTHPDDLAESLAVIERLRSGAEDAFELEKRYLDSDGQTVWGLVKVRMLRHPDDAPRLMVTHVQDITERMRAERELRLNRDRLKRAQVVGHIGSWEHDPVTRRIWGSEEACRILGVPPTDEDQPVELVEARIHDWPAIRASMLEQLDSRAGYDVALAFNPLDGGPQRILRVVAEMVAVAPEQSERIVGVVEDITEQHETAGALRVAQERLELAVTSSGMGTWDWLLPDGSPVMGQNARRLFGIGAEDEGRLSEQLFSVLHPDDRNRVYEELARAFQMQSEIDTEFRVIWPDGGVHAVAVRGMVYRNAPGTTVRMTGVCWDVTARREAESLLKAHSDRLEQMVDERTRLLRAAQDELVRREKLAVLGQLAGGIGHELRNPLGVISNAVYYLKLTGAARDETGRDYLNIISSEVHTSQKIISDLLGFARTSRAECAAVNLPALVGEVLAGVAPAEGVETALEFPEDLPPLRADPGHVRQMLTNLIVNACQAMPGGGVLSIRARREGPRVRLLVADTGCGMSRAEQARIFEPLYSTKARGIGLGLSVTRNLVEANAGSIEVASEPGRGSTFSVLLPAQEHLP